ncbi:hypothetical protein [Galbibacter mesophilus]|uniref:hypothetical protein n=1 Tax=Galbibacter mesophilus TaxID=379069 RepID=UPI00191D8C07|nr:hypothetical protein [Galbibacter mesophilus]MCM5661951.1 hypothetical protein [Galbibacter mesophilus]
MNCKIIASQVSHSVSLGNELIKVMVPLDQNIEKELIIEITKKLDNKRVLIATEEYSSETLKELSTINFTELFEKKIEINSHIKQNVFDIIIVDRVPYGKYDDFTALEERKKASTLTNRINYIYKLYELPIVSISKTDVNSELRINHFKKKCIL